MSDCIGGLQGLQRQRQPKVFLGRETGETGSVHGAIHRVPMTTWAEGSREGTERAAGLSSRGEARAVRECSGGGGLGFASRAADCVTCAR